MSTGPVRSIEQRRAELQDPGAGAAVQSTQSVDQTAQPTASSQQQTAVKRETNQYELLGEREILALIKNFKELDDGEKSDLLQYMKELERKDPVKVKRLKRKMYEK